MSARVRQRCAIYTRKSSEEGLEQDFNSLDAQREACEAFIASQTGLGWSPPASTFPNVDLLADQASANVWRWKPTHGDEWAFFAVG